MAILVIFWSIFGDRMANLSLIVFKIGLYVKVTVNAGETNFKSISNNLAKMAINGHKIGQMPLWHKNIKWAKLRHFSSNFDIFFLNAYGMVTITKLYDL